MSFSSVVGHERPLRVLRKALASGRVPHAYLFWGPEGVGKERVAGEAARVLLCTEPDALARADGCGTCPACRKLDAGDHPDLHRVVPDGASIPVDAVRRLQESLSYRSFERGRKVAIIRDGFRMTREAANALLKTLEEPPGGTHIFLLVRHRSQLLPTLVSRCQSLRFDPLADDQVLAVLRDLGAPTDRAAALAEAAGGCPGAVWGEEPDTVLGRVREAEDLAARWDGLAAAERFAWAGRWAGRRDDLAHRLDCLEHALQRRMRRSAGDGRPDERTLDRVEAIARVRRWLDRNVNVQLALDALFLDAAGRKWEDHTCDP